MNDGRRPPIDVKPVRPTGSMPAERSPTLDDTQIGQLLVRAGVLGPEQVKAIVQLQKRERLRFGDAAMRLGMVGVNDLKKALARQYSYPFVQPGESRLSTALYAAYEPMGRRAEALRALRTQLQLRWFKDESKTLAVLEPTAGTGSSELAANLAIVFAQLGERTLLIDANFRGSRQQRLFGLDHAPAAGLSSVLADRCPLKQAIVPVPPFEGLALLPAGAPPPNPQELLGRVSFSYILETAPAVYDVVIVDAPPVNDYADAQVVASRTGASLLVARLDKTRAADLRRARELLEPSGTQVLGAVACH